MKVRGLRFKDQEGAGVVEFAIIAPLFAMLLFGLVEFGLAMYNKGVVTNASREGARFGVVFSTPKKSQADIINKVQEYLTKSGFKGSATINVTGAQGASGNPLTVSVSYPYNFQVLPNFVSGMVGSPVLRANTVMLME